MRKLTFYLVFTVMVLVGAKLNAQELNAKVNINYTQIESPKTEIFTKMQTTI